MSTNVQITTLDVPNTFCHSTWQATWPTLVGLLQATLEGDIQTVNFGSTTPAAEDRDKPRFLINAAGTPAYSSWASYSSGNWLARHPLAPGIIVLYEGSAVSIDTFDGGEAGAVTATTGPFWERVTAMDAKFPIGPGVLPSGASASIGATGGNVIESAQTPDIPQGLKETQQTGGDETTRETVPHTNLPPWRAIFFIRRTARLYHRQ